MDNFDYINGFVERKVNGHFEGKLCFEGGIDLSPIEAQYFKKDTTNYLWLKRKPILEYDPNTMTYRQREREPRWEVYMEKQQTDNNVIAYKGEFKFMRFAFSIVGVWDAILGKDKKQRLNLFVERLPMSQQTIINNINERKRNEYRTRK